jgi:nucleoside-diphosphate kinase
MESTLVIIKPDAFQRRLVGTIVTEFENKGFKIQYMSMKVANSDTLKEHYSDMKEHPMFEKIIEGMSTAPIVVLVLHGLNAVKTVRKMIGSTDPAKADPGTIRGRYALDIGRNIIHASDSIENANREINLWTDALCGWDSVLDPVIVRS